MKTDKRSTRASLPKSAQKMKEKRFPAGDHHRKGQNLLNENKYDEAISEFNKAIAIEKGDGLSFAAYFDRAKAYEGKGDFAQAAADYTVAVDAMDGFWIFHMHRGDAYFKDGDYGLAIADYTAVLETRWYYTDAILKRGHAYLLKHELQRAIEDYTTFLMKCPGDEDEVLPKLQEALAGVSSDSPAAVCANIQLTNKEARSQFLKAQGRDSEPPYNFIIYGPMRECKNDADQAAIDDECRIRAIAGYTALLDDFPEHYLVRYFRGINYLKKGDYDPAIVDFNAILEISPRFPEVLSRRGRAYHLKHELQRAIEDYTAFIALCPGSTMVRKMLQEAFDGN